MTATTTIKVLHVDDQAIPYRVHKPLDGYTYVSVNTGNERDIDRHTFDSGWVCIGSVQKMSGSQWHATLAYGGPKADGGTYKNSGWAQYKDRAIEQLIVGYVGNEAEKAKARTGATLTRETVKTEIMAMLRTAFEEEANDEKACVEIQRDYGYDVRSQIEEKQRARSGGQLYVLYNLAERYGLTDPEAGRYFYIEADALRQEVRAQVLGQ